MYIGDLRDQPYNYFITCHKTKERFINPVQIGCEHHHTFELEKIQTMFNDIHGKQHQCPLCKECPLDQIPPMYFKLSESPALQNITRKIIAIEKGSSSEVQCYGTVDKLPDNIASFLKELTRSRCKENYLLYSHNDEAQFLRCQRLGTTGQNLLLLISVNDKRVAEEFYTYLRGNGQTTDYTNCIGRDRYVLICLPEPKEFSRVLALLGQLKPNEYWSEMYQLMAGQQPLLSLHDCSVHFDGFDMQLDGYGAIRRININNVGELYFKIITNSEETGQKLYQDFVDIGLGNQYKLSGKDVQNTSPYSNDIDALLLLRKKYVYILEPLERTRVNECFEKMGLEWKTFLPDVPPEQPKSTNSSTQYQASPGGSYKKLKLIAPCNPAVMIHVKTPISEEEKVKLLNFFRNPSNASLEKQGQNIHVKVSVGPRQKEIVDILKREFDGKLTFSSGIFSYEQTFDPKKARDAAKICPPLIIPQSVIENLQQLTARSISNTQIYIGDLLTDQYLVVKPSGVDHILTCKLDEKASLEMLKLLGEESESPTEWSCVLTDETKELLTVMLEHAGINLQGYFNGAINEPAIKAIQPFADLLIMPFEQKIAGESLDFFIEKDGMLLKGLNSNHIQSIKFIRDDYGDELTVSIGKDKARFDKLLSEHGIEYVNLKDLSQGYLYTFVNHTMELWTLLKQQIHVPVPNCCEEREAIGANLDKLFYRNKELYPFDPEKISDTPTVPIKKAYHLEVTNFFESGQTAFLYLEGKAYLKRIEIRKYGSNHTLSVNVKENPNDFENWMKENQIVTSCSGNTIEIFDFNKAWPILLSKFDANVADRYAGSIMELKEHFTLIFGREDLFPFDPVPEMRAKRN